MKVNKRKTVAAPPIEAVLAGDLLRLTQALESGENVDARDTDGRTALHHACIQDQEGFVDLLMRFNAHVGDKDVNGWTPLHFAAANYAVNIARKLLRAGAPVDATDSHGNTPLFRAVFESRGKGAMIQLLLDHGADRHRKNNHDTSPVDLGATIANFDVARWLSPRDPPSIPTKQ